MTQTIRNGDPMQMVNYLIHCTLCNQIFFFLTYSVPPEKFLYYDLHDYLTEKYK